MAFVDSEVIKLTYNTKTEEKFLYIL